MSDMHKILEILMIETCKKIFVPNPMLKTLHESDQLNK